MPAKRLTRAEKQARTREEELFLAAYERRAAGDQPVRIRVR
jgi:hypothetical protein